MPKKKVAIIGAGVAGCYCAFRLANENPGADIHLFEKSDRVGGRLFSLLGDDDAARVPIELGGMTFADSQENIMGLVEHLGLDPEEVEFDREAHFLRGAFLGLSDYVHPSLVPFSLDSDEERLNPYELLRKALLAVYPEYMDNWPFSEKGLDKSETYRHLKSIKAIGSPLKGVPLHKWGFWNLLSQVLSSEAYNLVRQAIGLSTMFRNINAFDAIWNILQDNHLSMAKAHYRLKEGYQSLPGSLLKKVGKGATVCLGHELREVRLSSDGSMSLDFESDEKRATVDGIEQLILALPRGCIDRVRFANADAFNESWQSFSRSIKRVFGSRLYLVFEKEWWARSKFGPGEMKPNEIHYTTTDLPLRNCTYLGKKDDEKHAVLIASFADGVASSFWSGLVHPETREHPNGPRESMVPGRLAASDRMVDEAISQLQLLHADVVVPRPIDAVFVDWSREPSGTGWHAFEPYAESSALIPQSRQPYAGVNIHVCGETFVHHHGWVESAINSSELMLQEHFGLDRAEWISSNYLLEPMEVSMDNKLAQLLLDLSKDSALLKRFLEDPEAVMTEYELSEDQKIAVRSRDEEAIRQAAGGGPVIFTLVWDD